MKKGVSSNVMLILVFFVGLSLMLYPSISDYWNSFHSTRVVSNYVETVSQIDNTRYDAIMEEARAYNRNLAEKINPYYMKPSELEVYEDQLNVSYNRIMGYIEIDKIDVSLPIYHSVEESVLAVGIGHMEWTSLPVGGENTHCVLSGHRGLPSATLFSDLDQMEVGDTFCLNILDEILTYEVDQILIVDPDEADELRIVPGEDLCTLVTCTPYGINTHRLLVRGHRVENAVVSTVRVTADAIQLEPLMVAPIVAAPMLLVLLVLLLLPKRRR